MKNVVVTIGLATLLAGTTQAQITIRGWKSGQTLLSSFAPKLASDGQNDVVTIAGTGTGLSALETQLGSYLDLPTQVSWAGSTNFIFSPSQQFGQGTSIALAFGGSALYNVAIEVHQGGQESGSSLWLQLGSGAPPLSSGITRQSATQFGPGPWTCGPYPRGCGAGRFDYGYNPTVAADLDGPPSANSATVVEVHQSADTGESALYYHVGVVTLSTSPSITWGSSLQVSSTIQGSAPTVSISNNVAVLVFQGSGGTLLYSIGVVDPATSTVAWTEPSSYGSGYSPTVSVSGSGTGLPQRVLVEAHQLDAGTGPLVYSVGVMGASPTSITWSSASGTPANINYATGCSPSVALAFAGHTPVSQVSATETHADACGRPTTTEARFGHLVGK